VVINLLGNAVPIGAIGQGLSSAAATR